MREFRFAIVLIFYAVSFAYAQEERPENHRLEWQGRVSEVTLSDTPSLLSTRTYEMRSTLQNPSNPALTARNFPETLDKRRTLREKDTQPQVRMNHPWTEALFSMAMSEMNENQAPGGLLKDRAYNYGQGVPCLCFKAGKEWGFVWTRDTAYSAHLSLGLLSPIITGNSLEFKVSKPRLGSLGTQIIQDTGTGGAWPVSTDRVSWALGAQELLRYLDGIEKIRFRDLAADALIHTLEYDRQSVYDPRDGLYRGESSFLDWREQSYPQWMGSESTHIAMSKTLSTNVTHYLAIRAVASLLKEKDLTAQSEHYQDWADRLGASIQRHFWLEEKGLFSSLKVTDLAPQAVQAYDLLGSSLVILSGIAQREQALSVLSHYPQMDAGPPVIWPQLQRVPIYHNRAIWPFATAYWALAARQVKHDAAFVHAFRSLVRGPALSLSHMENFEFISQSPFVDDGAWSGPVVNSERQLWSVAGFLGVVIKGIFGLETSEQGIRFQPYLPSALVSDFFSSGNEITLRNIPFHGKVLHAKLRLKSLLTQSVPQNASGRLKITSLLVNGKPQDAQTWTKVSELQDTNEWVLEMEWEPTIGRSPEKINLIKIANPKKLSRDERELIFAPLETSIQDIREENDSIRIGFKDTQEPGVFYNIFRNGVSVARGIRGSTWVDTHMIETRQTACYSIEAEYESSGLKSHISEPKCYWPPGSIRHFLVSDRSLMGRNQNPSTVFEHGRMHFNNWGNPGEELETVEFSVVEAAQYRIQLLYGNAHGPINTGVTAVTKWVDILDAQTGQILQSGLVVLPHRLSWDHWGGSTFFSVHLEERGTYRLRVRDAMNMSYFEYFSIYTALPGGISGPLNTANIEGIRLLRGP